MKAIKKNVLRLFLLVCGGLIVGAITFASVRTIFGPPGPPGRPSVYDIGKDYCVISYLKPQTDNGSPIIQFRIEKMVKREVRWQIVGSTVFLEERINGLIEKSEVMFRVSALNRAGYGPYSAPTDFVTIRDPF